MDKRRIKDKLQIKHITQIYDVSRPTVQKAKNEGKLEFGNNGWIEASKVIAWAGENNISKRSTEEIKEAVQKISGGGLVGDDMIKMLLNIDIPGQAVLNAEDAEKTAKAIIGTLTAQEKRVRQLKDVGRLGDLAELAAVVDGVIQKLVESAKKIDNELTATLARKHKVPATKVKPMMGDITKHLLGVYEAAIASLEGRIRRFEDEKASENKPRKRNK